MIHFFNRETLYCGGSMKTFVQIRNILENHHIPYRYTVRNRMTQWAGRGTMRGRMGSAGQMNSQEEYEIFVHKKDREKAAYLVKREAGN